MNNDFDQYQAFTRTTAKYPNQEIILRDDNGDVIRVISPANFLYTIQGLAEEAGEVAGKMKKFIRDGHNYEDFRAAVIAELGDVLWYVARSADELGIKLSDVVASNEKKLSSRKDRGVLGGSGDTR